MADGLRGPVALSETQRLVRVNVRSLCEESWLSVVRLPPPADEE